MSREERDAPCAAEDQEALRRVGRKLLRRIERFIDEDELELKELKTVTGALKELQGLWEDRDRGESGRALTVLFEGETEELSR